MPITISFSSALHFLFRVAFVACAITYLALLNYSSFSIWTMTVVILSYLFWVKRTHYLDPMVAFVVPWLITLSFTILPISEYATAIDPKTYRLVFLAIFTALIVAGGRVQIVCKSKTNFEKKKAKDPVFVSLAGLEIAFALLTILNVVMSGYIPLLRGITTGDTGYLQFGVHGFYGFYLALANALAILYFFLFLKTKNRRYLWRYLIIIGIFIAFITRQNILSTAVETMVVYALAGRRVKWKLVLPVIFVIVMLNSLIGSLRAGSIKDIARVKQEYRWLPEPIIWVYSYSYFCIANVDNLVVHLESPYYNGSSLSALVPSFVRPEYEMDQYLVVSNFTVSSFIFSVYQDGGVAGVILVVAFALAYSAKKYVEASDSDSFKAIGSYSVLYFCAMFSFFTNMWFYLPVIFQLAFIPFMSNIAETVIAEDRSSSYPDLSPGNPTPEPIRVS